MKDIKQQIPLPLDQPPKPRTNRTLPSPPRDTGGKPVPMEKLTKRILRELVNKKSRKVASVTFIIYQLVEMTISLADTL